jgi:Ca2+-binding EF-hand superfamily protein
LHEKQKELLAQHKAARLTDLTEQVKRRFPHATRAEIDELQRQFDTFDLDGSGNISVDELRTAMRNLGEYTDEAQLQQLMAAGDADGSGEIDFAEFAAIVLNLRGGAEAGIFARLVAKQRRMVEFCNFTRDKLLRMRKEFDQFDVDQSGSIDARELEDALRNLGEYKSQAQLDEIMAEADEVGVGADGWLGVGVGVGVGGCVVKCFVCRVCRECRVSCVCRVCHVSSVVPVSSRTRAAPSSLSSSA